MKNLTKHNAGIYAWLRHLTIGLTTTVNGHVITRWSQNGYEVDTWGKTTVGVDEVLGYLETAGTRR